MATTKTAEKQHNGKEATPLWRRRRRRKGKRGVAVWLRRRRREKGGAGTIQ